ncbi:MAG TPA: amidohydrolase family protein [Deltaproteobacteria bacterium]|nr:amidohydrolase family protein [Deltaproteobacteria bacterium]
MKEETADIAIKGGTLVTSQAINRGVIYIKDGRVESIEPEDSNRSAFRVIDATGKYVLPGIIDAHLHPVYADKIDTLSQSAAFGGITTLIPFIGAIRAWGKTGDLYDAVTDFIKEGEEKSAVDFGIHCSLCHDDMETVAEVIPKVVDLGVISFKAFMAYSKRGMKLEDGELMKVMEIVAGNDAFFAVHAENGTILDYLEEKFVSEGRLGPEMYPLAQPNIAEAEAVFRILTLAKIIQCPMYLPHLSASESLQVVRLFKEWGEPRFFSETCVHYLTLTDDEMKKRGSLAKVGPPLRKPKDVENMWKAVDEGLIDVIASDTAGHLVKSKEPLWENVFKAPSGLPGVETLFTVAYDEGVNNGRVTLPLMVKLMCENPARIFGLYPQKGVLQKGSDADLVIFDPTLPHTIRADAQHAKVDYSMYEGRACVGAPVLVMQRGNVLVENGELKASSGQGKYLPRKNIAFK